MSLVDHLPELRRRLVIALVAVAVGVPLGVAVGRTVWRWFADSLFVAAPAETPWVWVAVATPAIVVLANLVAAIPGRSAGRTSAALVLRDD
jgi:predicted lysophospholipase L1 biosynthesis ABC-type transport system permease subunit